MKKLIEHLTILIKRQDKLFKGSFFKSRLEATMKEWFPNHTTSDITIVHDGDALVKKSILMLGYEKTKECKEDAHPKGLTHVIAFWDGPKYRNMPPDLVDPTSEAMAGFLAFYANDVNKKVVDVRHRWPSIMFRCIGAIYKEKKSGHIVDEAYAIQRFLSFKSQAKVIEDDLNLGEDSVLIHDEDTIKRTRIELDPMHSIFDEHTVTTRVDKTEADPDIPVADETTTILVETESVRRLFLRQLESLRFSKMIWEQIAMDFDRTYAKYAM